MPNARILGTGGHVPEHVVTNDDLVEVYGMDTSDEWITRRTGVKTRRFAAEGVSTSDLGLKAAERALEDAGIAATDLDMIVFCTLSPDKAFPGSGVYLQDKLGLPAAGRYVPCLDVRNQCSGFLYGLSHAVGAIRGGMARTVLVVGAEVHSAALDLTTRGRRVASLFGDGAGAVVVGATDEDAGVRHVTLGADGSHADALSQGVWDMGRRPFIPLDEEGYGRVHPRDLWARMNGPLVYRHAIARMVEVLEQACAAEKLTPGDLDLVLFHQANLRINQKVQQILGIDDDAVLHHVARYGNTTAATIPLLLAEATRSGRLVEGMTVALVAFGSGFTWGAILIDW